MRDRVHRYHQHLSGWRSDGQAAVEVGKGKAIGKKLKQAVRAPALPDNLGFLLARVGGSAIRLINRGLGDTGLRHRHYTILMALRDRDRLSQRELAATLDVDPSAIVSLLDDLVAMDLVRRDPHPADRRTHEVTLTDVGRAEAERIAELGANIQEELVASLSDKEIQVFIDLLARVAGLTQP